MATTADYLNKLVEQKNTLADNLVTKGVDATHDETLDTLVPKVLDISSGSDKYFIYNNGQELNDNVVTLYHVGSSSEKTASWIYMYYWYRGVIETDQLSLGGYKKIGVCANLKRNGSATPFFTKMSLRSSGNVELSGNDYAPTGNIIGTEYAPIDDTVDTSIKKYEGIYYIDIPQGVDSGYLVIDSVNVDVYLLSIWLEQWGDYMDRRDELMKILNDANNSVVNPLIDEILYLEDQLEMLRKLPKIKVNPQNPEQQKATPAAKLYKEYLQQYLNAIKLLSSVTKTDVNDEESPLRKWVNSRVNSE